MDGTYPQNAKIKFYAPSVSRSWFSLSNNTDITLKKGWAYLLMYSFTPTTVDGGITGCQTYSNATVWKTGSYQTLITPTTADFTDALINNGNTNTFVWLRMTIVRLAQGGGA